MSTSNICNEVQTWLHEWVSKINFGHMKVIVLASSFPLLFSKYWQLVIIEDHVSLEHVRILISESVYCSQIGFNHFLIFKQFAFVILAVQAITVCWKR